MIIVKIIGGLGNQLFQYSMGRAIEKKLGKDVYFDISEFENYELRNLELYHFNTEIKLAPKERVQELKNLKNKLLFKIFSKLRIQKLFIKYLSYYQEYIEDYSRDIFDLNKQVYLDGYWQSEKYFLDIKDVIINELVVKTPASNENQKLLKNILIQNSVSVHIRRGDYINNNKVNQLYGTCSLEYYQKACDYISSKIENPVFYIFSDDIEWAKSNLGNQYNKIFVDINSADKAYEDLRLMSSCKHNIIANSSFSWWGAWLNSNLNKVVIAPDIWFVNTRINSKDIIPNSWIRI